MFVTFILFKTLLKYLISILNTIKIFQIYLLEYFTRQVADHADVKAILFSHNDCYNI